MNPWFVQWPQDIGARRSVVRPAAAGKPAPMKSIATVLRDGNYPARFLQIIPFSSGDIGPGASVEIPIKLDEDFPYRLDALQVLPGGFVGASGFCEMAVQLPSGRDLTRAPVSVSGFSGSQGGKCYVHFRHRFAPADSILLIVRNTHPTETLHVSGVAYGYKLPTESRL